MPAERRETIIDFLGTVRWVWIYCLAWTVGLQLVQVTGLLVIDGVSRGVTWPAWVGFGLLCALFVLLSALGFRFHRKGLG